jgi:hypothetical protein
MGVLSEWGSESVTGVCKGITVWECCHHSSYVCGKGCISDKWLEFMREIKDECELCSALHITICESVE